MKRRVGAEIISLLEKEYSYTKIANILNVSKGLISYHANKIKFGPPCAKKYYDWTAIANDYHNGMTVRECRSKWGFSNGAWDKHVSMGLINTRNSNKYIPLDDVLKSLDGRKMLSRERAKVKVKMLGEGVSNCCSECSLKSEWNGKPLSFHLDHKDGNPRNNTRINLRLLCPNCHSQTDTYGWKNAVIKNQQC